MRIEVFLDKLDQPIQSLTPPETFSLNTEKLDDGPHQLFFKATDNDGVTSVRVVSFKVQNGPAIAVHGIVDGDTLSGDVSILANAYGARVGDEFEPLRMETPTPVPTWAWVLLLGVLAWGAGYLSLELRHRIDTIIPLGTAVATATPADGNGTQEWAALGAQVYGNNCASCHQANGSGLPGVFPSLVGNSAVMDDDPTDHIKAIVSGLSGKVIDGVAYVAPMPPFGSALSDEAIAAVVNHERSQWGNSARTVTAADVAAAR